MEVKKERKNCGSFDGLCDKCGERARDRVNSPHRIPQRINAGSLRPTNVRKFLHQLLYGFGRERGKTSHGESRASIVPERIRKT